TWPRCPLRTQRATTSRLSPIRSPRSCVCAPIAQETGPTERRRFDEGLAADGEALVGASHIWIRTRPALGSVEPSSYDTKAWAGVRTRLLEPVRPACPLRPRS